MGTCQTQQNIDINLFINNGETKTKKRYSLDKKQKTKKNMSQIMKKVYLNNVQFNNTKKSINEKIKNKIPVRNKITKEIILINKNNKDNISRIITNRLNHSYTGEKIPIDNIRSLSRDSKRNINLSFNNNNNILTDRNTNSITKDSDIIGKKENIKRKIIKDEDDTEKIISHLNEQIKNKKEKNKNDSLILSFDDFEGGGGVEFQMYYLNEFNFNSDNKYSKEKDFDDLLQGQVYQNKINFTNLILSLPERKWYNELIELSDKFKLARKQKKIDDLFLTEILNKIIKIYNHFNNLVWAIAYYYSNSLFLKKNYWFKNDTINLPYYKSLEYIRGFEWKGLHIRVLTYEQSKIVKREIKSLKIAFFDFLTLFNSEYTDINLLSNEIIFPLMSYAYIGGIFLYVSVEIKKFCYDSNFFNFNNNIIPKNDSNKFDRLYKSLIKKNLRFSDKNEINDCTIDNSDDNFSFDDNILNEEINISNYSKNDLKDTKILKNLNEEHLLKIFDEYTDEKKAGRKFKFILKNRSDLIPNLFKEDDKTIYKRLNILNCLDIKNEFKEPRYVNLTKVNNLDKINEMDILSKLIRIKASKENIEIYKNRIEEIDYKIIYDNNKKGNKINEQITKFFIQFPLIQNYELSRLLITEYLNVGNLNGILNKYYKENTQEIPDRNIIIFRTSFKTKTKLALLNINKKENLFPKSTEEYISYLKQFSKELSLSSTKIKNVDNLFYFCDKFGFNKKFLPFCLEYITDESIRNLIQIYLYVFFIKKFYNYKESQTLLMKLAIFERNKDDSIINSSEIIKDNNIIETQKNFFLGVIKLIFVTGGYLGGVDGKNNFSKIFIENISFFIFLRMLKIKNFEKYINFKSSLAQIDIKQILQNFNEICRQNPFLFLDTLERMLNIRINSFIKYKCSIDINNIKNLKKDDIVIFIPQVNSFIDISSISSYILTILLNNTKNKNNNSILSKIDFGFFFPQLIHSSPINYIDNKLILKKINYNINNEEIKIFCEMIEQMLDGIISYNGDKELILSKIYFYLLLNSLFCKNNLTEAQEILIKIKNILSYQNLFSLSQKAILYLIEGLINNKINNISKAEDNYIKSLFLLLLNQGDIINKNNKINAVIIFPVIQLIKILSGSENKNNYLNGYLNELLYILKEKFKNFKETIKILESDINPLSDNYIKFFICNSIIEYFYSKDNLIYNEDVLSLYKVINKIEIIKKRNNYYIDHLFDEMSYKKNAPNNIVIYFGEINNIKTKPRIMYSLLGKNIKKIFAGFESNFAINEENKIFAWGLNTEGQLGIKPDIKNRYINHPIKISIKDLENNENIINILCHEKFSLFLSNKNRVYISGNFIFYQKKYFEPTRVNFIFEKEKINQIALGLNFILFLTGWGNVYSIEENNGINKIINLNNIQKIFCGYKHSFAIAKKNIIFCWGENTKGQLGLNEFNENVLIPKKLVLNYNNDVDIDNIFCGKDFTIFQNYKKEILVCGNNDEGQLGIKKEKCLRPVLNEQFYNLNIIKISCGEKFCVAMIKDKITNSINIWAWGRNKEGQLGFNDNVENSRPKLVPFLLEFINHYPKDISCGKNHCLVLLEKKDEINIDDNDIFNQIISKYNKF